MAGRPLPPTVPTLGDAILGTAVPAAVKVGTGARVAPGIRTGDGRRAGDGTRPGTTCTMKLGGRGAFAGAA